MRRFAKVLETIASHTYEAHSKIFWQFVTIAACCCACESREPEYLAEIKHVKPEILKLYGQAFAELITEMEQNPYSDLLGPTYMEWGNKGDQQFRGEFFTPQHLCDMIAAMTFDPSQVPLGRPMMMDEPCSGAGQMILSLASQFHKHDIPLERLHVVASDVNKLCCNMTYVNMTLWHIPGVVVWQNTLTLETWGSWKTVALAMLESDPAYRMLKVIHDLQSLFEPIDAVEEPASLPVATSTVNKRGQVVMDL